MFTADMLAPCGLDCSLCQRAQDPERPCPGCNREGEYKPEFCSARCGIVRCERRLANGWRFCDVCPGFPCADVMEKENRYTAQYPLRESPLENLSHVRKAGMDAFLDAQRRQWTCRACGGPVCVHTGRCGKCGAPAENAVFH